MANHKSDGRKASVKRKSSKKDCLSTLPPEILSQIFLRPSTPDSPPFLPVASTPICRSLLPFTRPAAYRHLTFDSPIALAAFGFTLSQPSCALLGPLVESIHVLEPRPAARGFAGADEASVAWLGPSFRRAFEGMACLAEVRVGRVDFLEGEEMMRTAGWQNVRRVVVATGENVGYEALRWLHLAPKLVEVEVAGPMRYEASFPGRVSAFEPAKSGIKKLTINAEPHSAEFEHFFEHCDLEELHLRSSTTDAHRVFSSLGERARASLKVLSFATTGYLQHPLTTTFASFAQLQHLSLLSTQTVLSPTLFSTLSPLPLVSLSLSGPRSPSELNHLVYFVANERPATLGEVGVDVASGWGPAVQVKGVEGGEGEARGEGREIRRLKEVCEEMGVRLEGNVREVRAGVVRRGIE